MSKKIGTSYHVSFVDNEKRFDADIKSRSERNPINEKMYAKELFMMGREQAFVDYGFITEDQRLNYTTRYTGDIVNSVNYKNGYQRGIELAKTNTLPPEYLEQTSKKHR